MVGNFQHFSALSDSIPSLWRCFLDTRFISSISAHSVACRIIFSVRETQGPENIGDILVFGTMWLAAKMDFFGFVRGFVRCCYHFIETTLGL
jgi:hypothetical protein